MQKVLVTGGGGFIGSYVVAELVKKGIETTVLELPGTNVKHLPREVKLVFGNICDPVSVYKAVAGRDTVLHLAANPNLWDKDSSVFSKVNYQGTKNVLHVAQSVGTVKRFVHVSTESILYSPYQQGVVTEETETSLEETMGVYCRSKWLAEQAAVSANKPNFEVIVVNPTVPIGPGDRRIGPFSRLFCDFAAGKVRGYVDGLINFIDARDVAYGIIKAAEIGEPGKRYILGAENWQIHNLFEFLATLTEKSAPKFKVPYRLALFFAWLEEAYCKLLPNMQPMATVTGVKLARYSRPFDATETMRKLGLQPRNVAASLKEMYVWLQEKNRA